MRTIAALIILMSMAVHVSAQESEIYAPAGVAINGYDPVAFFTESTIVKGTDSLTLKWKDVTWQFASKNNLEAFSKDPEKFSPQYGGYCAYGTSEGHKAPTQVETWTIVDGKLYFNYNTRVQQLWNKDQQNHIKLADEKWPGIKNQK